MGGSGSTNSTVTQTNLPSYARPYYEAMMADAQSVADKPYQAYEGPRIANLNSSTTGAISTVNGLQNNNGSMQAGTSATQSAADKLGQSANYTPGTVDAGGSFRDSAQSYMSPYMDAVVANQKKGATQDFAQQAGDRAGAAVQAGALGGTRRSVADALANDDLNDRLATIDANGYQQAYQAAQSQYNTENARDIDVAKTNVSNNMQGQQMSQAALQAQGALGNQLFNQGTALNDQTLKNAEAQMNAGKYLQDYDQSKLDLAYNDFNNQNDYQKQQLNWLSGILHGVPVTANSNVTQTTGGGNNVGNALGGLGLLMGQS
jgi:hypothetical protein